MTLPLRACSLLGGGKFANGAVAGAFGYLFNARMHHACWPSSTDLAEYKTGGPYGFWKSMCAGGDPLACQAMGSAANAPVDPLSLGAVAKLWLENAYQYAHATQWIITPTGQMIPLNGQMSTDVETQYSQAIADAYIKYLGTTEAGGRWPSWDSINRLHWGVNESFGLPPSAYAATPFGSITPNWPMKDLVCPGCSP
jgi:hypothetical protein